MTNGLVTDIFSFFDEIGLKYQCVDDIGKTFLPGVKICEGGLLVQLDSLTYPSDLLHEAGHIAVTDASHRNSLAGDMKDEGHSGAEETAAIAWSWAAAMYIGITADELFHAGGYRGASANLIEAFSAKRGFGYPLLYSWFMCERPEHPEGYPKMQRWFRCEQYRLEQLEKLHG